MKNTITLTLCLLFLSGCLTGERAVPVELLNTCLTYFPWSELNPASNTKACNPDNRKGTPSKAFQIEPGMIVDFGFNSVKAFKNETNKGGNLSIPFLSSYKWVKPKKGSLLQRKDYFIINYMLSAGFPDKNNANSDKSALKDFYINVLDYIEKPQISHDDQLNQGLSNIVYEQLIKGLHYTSSRIEKSKVKSSVEHANSLLCRFSSVDKGKDNHYGALTFTYPQKWTKDDNLDTVSVKLLEANDWFFSNWKGQVTGYDKGQHALPRAIYKIGSKPTTLRLNDFSVKIQVFSKVEQSYVSLKPCMSIKEYETQTNRSVTGIWRERKYLPTEAFETQERYNLHPDRFLINFSTTLPSSQTAKWIKPVDKDKTLLAHGDYIISSKTDVPNSFFNGLTTK